MKTFDLVTKIGLTPFQRQNFQQEKDSRVC